MTLAYQKVYNDEVIEKGQPYNISVLGYLDDHFKDSVTKSLEICLSERPEDPIRFFVDHFVAEDASARRDAERAAYAGQRVSILSQRELQGSPLMTPPPARAGDSSPQPDASSGTQRTNSILSTTASVSVDESARRRSVSNVVLHFDGGVMADVRPARPFNVPAQPEMVADNVPCVRIMSPNIYDIETTLNHMEASVSFHTKAGPVAPTLVIVEPPPAPTEVVFLKGIPYVTKLVEQLQYHSRRGNDGAPRPQKGQSFSQTALGLLRKQLGSDMESLAEAIDKCVKPDSAGQHRRVVHLPAVQSSYCENFDLIDRELIDIAYPDLAQRNREFSDGPKAFPAPVSSSPPLVVFISYNAPASAKLTYSRVLSSFFPLFERAQLSKMKQIAMDVRATQRNFNLNFCVGYWDEVHKRREARDISRGGSKRIGSSRINVSSRGHSTPKFGTKANTQPPTPIKADEAAAATRTGTASVEASRKLSAAVDARKQVLAARDARRQEEDTAFLNVVRHYRTDAATRIQTAYRSHRIRRQMAAEQRSPIPKPAAAAEATDAHKCIHAKPLPPDVPLFLQVILNRLSSVHGEIFGNYEATPPAAPRCVKVIRPKRKPLPAAAVGSTDDDDASEAEDWEAETLLLPSKRSTEPLPHFNVLRRLLEYHHLADCTTLDDAMRIQRDCTGMSKMQRHAYDLLKSVALSLLHIAYVELFHRGALGVDVVLFSQFVERFHGAVVGWLSTPHFVSFEEDLARQPAAGDTLLHALEHKAKMEHLLLPVLPVSPFTSNALLRRELVVRVAPNVYRCIAPALPAEAWESALRSLAEHHPRSRKSGGSPGSTDTHESSSLCSTTPAANMGLAAHVQVSWWAMCPYPTVYVNDHPFVLATRGDHQLVQGKARYDEFVLRSSHYRFHSETPSAEDGAEEKKKRNDVEVFVETGGGLVVDGMEYLRSDAKKAKPSSALPKLTSTEEPIPSRGARRSTALSRLLKRSIVEYEKFAKSIVDRQANKEGKVVYYDEHQCTTSGDEAHRDCDGFIYHMQDGLCGYEKLMQCAQLDAKHLDVEHVSNYSPQNSNNSNTDNDDNDLPCAQTAPAPRSLSTSPPRSGRLRSSSRGDNWSKLIEAVAERCISLPPSRRASISLSVGSAGVLSALTSPNKASPVRPATSAQLGNPNVRTQTTMIDLVCAKVNEVSLEFLRPWIPHIVAGNEWLMQYEGFVEQCVTQVRAKRAVVLALEYPKQWLFLATAAVIGHMVDEVTSANAAMSIKSEGEKRTTERKEARVLDAEARGALAFMQEFYDVIGAELRNNGIKMNQCVQQIESVCEETCSPDFHCLADIAKHILAAETEPNVAKCRHHVLQAVRLAEQFCWLVLLQVFLSMPFASASLDRSKDTPLTSFSSFVANSVILTWIRTIDPWKHVPQRCPDSAHLRYSNGFRRWDSTSYICYGPI